MRVLSRVARSLVMALVLACGGCDQDASSAPGRTVHDGEQWSFFYATGDRCHTFEARGPTPGVAELADAIGRGSNSPGR